MCLPWISKFYKPHCAVILAHLNQDALFSALRVDQVVEDDIAHRAVLRQLEHA